VLFSLSENDRAYTGLRKKVRHVSLHEDEQFQDVFVEEMAYPE
jgi:hypothetical protein